MLRQDVASPIPSAFTLTEIGSEWDARWDELAGASPEAGFMQSSAWGAFKRAEGYQTARLGLFDTRGLAGGAALLYYPGPSGGGLILCPEGPVLPWDNMVHARAGLRLLTRAARELPCAPGAIGLRIEPHLPPPAPSLIRNWSRTPVDLTPVHTLMLDLTLNDEELLAQMHPKGRYNVRLSQRHGVPAIRSMDLADMAAFYRLFRQTAERNAFFAEPYGFFLNLGANMFPANAAELFLAESDGELLSGILVVYFGRRATYLYGGSAPLNRGVMPNHALHWAAIHAARERGCVEYDLYGYDPFGMSDHLYAGISRFKRQWGGRRHDSIGARDYLFYDRIANQVVELTAQQSV